MEIAGGETQLSVEEVCLSQLNLALMVETCSSDCYVVVYAVDDTNSFGEKVIEEDVLADVFIADSAVTALASLASHDCLAGKSAILVGNKTDLARSRLVQTEAGCNAAIMAGVKFVETSAGIGHNIEELLVGIVMQCRWVVRMFWMKMKNFCFRLQNEQQKKNDSQLKQTIKGILGISRKGSKC